MANEKNTAADILRIVQDSDCPGCGWPETVAIGVAAIGPDHLECGRWTKPCGWRADVERQA